MTSISSTNIPVQPQQPVVVNNIPKKVRRLAFKAENDSFTKQNGPVYTQPPMLDQQAAMRRAIEEQKKAQKAAKTKQNISWAAGLLSAAAIIAVAVLSFKSMKGDSADLELVKKIKEKLPKVKDLSIKQQVEAELRMNAHERNLYRAENLIRLDELAQDTSSRAKVPIDKLKQNLDNKIIGIESAKEELIKGVKKANYNIEHGLADTKPTVIILDGAPGTSKTTLAKEYADAAGLYYKKIPCGGISDAQSIIGFKRTYMGSVQGVIAEAQVESGTKGVCYCLDEIDRVTKKEILDALLSPFEEKAIFIDQYYGVPIDLSRSTFVMTTNDFTRLPEALKNRATIVHIKDYTPAEKANIARLKLNMRIEKDKAAQYIESIDDSIYEEIANRTSDKGGRQVDLLTEEIMSTIKGMQQEGLVSTDKKVKIDKAFLDEIKLGEKMQEAARIEAERANNAEWQFNNL